MSKYMELRAKIEEMQAEAERVKKQEVEEQVVDIKKRIIAFGITADQLYLKDDLAAALEHANTRRPKTTRERADKGVPRTRKPPKYKLGSRSWSGIGDKPHWFRIALKEGHTEAEMAANAQANNVHAIKP